MRKKTIIKSYLKPLTKRTILVFLIFILSLVCFNFSSAASLSDLQKQKEEINKNISDKNSQIKDKNSQIKQTNLDIASLDQDIAEIQSKIGETQGQIDSTENDIAAKEEEISNKNLELNIEYENQKEAVRVMYESGFQDELFVLIGSNSLSEIINQSDYLESIESRIESTIDKINDLKKQLEDQKAELEAKNNELSKLQEQQQAYRYGLDQSKAQKNKVVANAENEKKSLEAQIEEAKKLSQQVESQINSIVAAMNKSSGSVSATDRGTSAVGFQWPMNYKYITCYYGESTPFQSFHSGIDLANIAGTPIYAAADGTVTVAADMMSGGSYYGYGKYLVIGHNARYSSLYAHLMGFAVSVGQEVSRGDLIGYEGNTGWSTGPHLHFEIWDNGARVNPLSYLP